MQLDAGMGALNAVFEILLQQRIARDDAETTGDELVVYPSPVVTWEAADIQGLCAEGGLRCDLTIRHGQLQSFAATATRAWRGVIRFPCAMNVSGERVITWRGQLAIGERVAAVYGGAGVT